LSLPVEIDANELARFGGLAAALLGEGGDDDRQTAATKVVQAQLQLLRIHEVRAQLTARFDEASGDCQNLWRLAALDHYERLAMTQRRRGSRKL
jgi:hypothetical protein